VAQQLDLVNDTALRGDYPTTVVRQPCAPRPDNSCSSTVLLIERRRKASGLTHSELCRRAGVDQRNWFNLLSGAHAALPATLRKLSRALDAQAPARPPQILVAFHRVCLGLVADALGLDRTTVLTTDFSVQRPALAGWLEAARARMIAIYITSVELEVDNAELARALGTTRQAIKKARDRIEDLRDDAAIDAAIEAVSQQVRG
jgi:transcriptional regulator with XRE-family HTH domain